MREFKETQRFNQWWLWSLMFLVFASIFIGPILAFIDKGKIVLKDFDMSFWIGAISVGAVIGFLRLIALKTRIDEQGVYYKFIPFHFNEKAISWYDIAHCHTRTYKPIREYGGWGYRISPSKGKALNVKGNRGVQIEFKNGNSLLLGTQRPDEAQKVINKYHKNERI